MGKINILPEHIVNQIAAGEVVERPASVVKELVENSIDAKAKHIKVYIEEFGTKLIEVIDDGSGISKEDGPNVFKLHATSKIAKASDLKAISTYGFRGEAIASIRSSASSIELLSKSESDIDGYSIKADPKEIVFTKKKPPERGAHISVHNLFSTIPARKKFLKTENTENNHIKECIKQFALANPNIHFELFIDSKSVFNFPTTNQLKDRVYDVLGKEIASNLFETTESTHPEISVKAFWGSTSLGKSRNSEQYMFINSRFVTNSTVYSAIAQAYQGFLHKSLKPTFVVFITLNPEKVDVNVHPRKLEVRFSDPKMVFTAVYKSALNTLQRQSKQELTQSFSTNNQGWASTDSIQPTEVPHVSHSLSNTAPHSFTHRTEHKSKIKEALIFTQKLLETAEDSQTSEYGASSGSLDSASIEPFQLFNTYILFERAENLIIIDQHAAAEKIAFEKLLKDYGVQKTKPLLVPEIIELSSKDLDIILANKAEIAQIGIIFEKFGNNSIQVIEIPEILKEIDIQELVDRLINTTGEFDSYYKEYESQSNSPLSHEAYYLIATSACHGSIRAGQKLSVVEMKNIIKDLFDLNNPGNCPHGRPTYYKLEKFEIEKNFKRILN